jgi:tRNA uridine 5-carboxymethylaminomethyl modification enzyme
LFIEPEGWDTCEYYVNGFSSSLPEDIQFDALHKVPGFERAKFFRPGYAIEYDYFPPNQLNYNLETKAVENLFFAGQINGTTGYEEAAAQGLMAGINAHLKVRGAQMFLLKRSEAYIGVLIDDLITKGTDEPYRMFTSRAEYRILLRQDNADLRLTEKSYNIGLASEERYTRMKKKYNTVNGLVKFINESKVEPREINPVLQRKETQNIGQRQRLKSILLRPQIGIEDLVGAVKELNIYVDSSEGISKEILEEAEIIIKYESYIEKEQELASKISRLENIVIPYDFDYHKILALSYEAREKLTKNRPGTIGQATRISGVSPADVSVLLVCLGR